MTARRLLTRLAGALALGLALAAPAAAPAQAASTRVVASGLDNPRHVFASGNAVYVAESGRGGAGTCIAGPEGGEVCFGLTGAVTRVARGVQERVVTGLPSLAGPDGSSASGPTDVDVIGANKVTVVIGLGGNPTTRAQLGPDAARLGTIVTGRFGKPLSVVADLAAYEDARDPDGQGSDSNPGGFVRRGNTFVTTDAGGNDLVAVPRYRAPATLAVLPDGSAEAPPFLGLPPGTRIPVQSVPTDVAVGPDGAYYVAELTGFPFPPGAATIWRVVPGQQPTAYATGLTNVTGLAWLGDRLYAVQLSDSGMLAGMDGSVRRVVPGAQTHPPVVDGLFAPYGIAISGRTAYVTTCSVCAGGGELLAFGVR